MGSYVVKSANLTAFVRSEVVEKSPELLLEWCVTSSPAHGSGPIIPALPPSTPRALSPQPGQATCARHAIPNVAPFCAGTTFLPIKAAGQRRAPGQDTATSQYRNRQAPKTPILHRPIARPTRSPETPLFAQLHESMTA